LKSGVISKLREQQKRFPIGSPTTEVGEEPPLEISIDDGTNPKPKSHFIFFFFQFFFVSAYNVVFSSKAFCDRDCYQPPLDEFKCCTYAADGGRNVTELDGRADFRPDPCDKNLSLSFDFSSLLFSSFYLIV
jgi:hypothetical protein